MTNEFLIAFVNLSAIGLCASAALVVYHKCILVPLDDSKRFKFYALRDRLAMLAMEGGVSEHSQEYKYLIRLTNSAIAFCDYGFSLSVFVKVVVDPQLERNVEAHKALELIKRNERLELIAHDLFKAMRRIVERELHMLNFFCFVFKHPITLAAKLAKRLHIEPPKKVENSNEAPRIALAIHCEIPKTKELAWDSHERLTRFKTEILEPALAGA